MNGEIHLFILWEKARKVENEIVSDIEKNFLVLQKTEFDWRDNFAGRISDFYGEKLPPHSNKERHVGRGKFLALVVLDAKPFYRIRRTSRGAKIVNVNMFDSKEMYRKWTGGGHKVHASNDVQEAEHDLFILFHKPLEELMSIYEGGETAEVDKPISKWEAWFGEFKYWCERVTVITVVYNFFKKKVRLWKREREKKSENFYLQRILEENGFCHIKPFAMKTKWSLHKKAYFTAEKNGENQFIKFSNRKLNNTLEGLAREWKCIEYLRENSSVVKKHLPILYEKYFRGGDWQYISMECIEAVTEDYNIKNIAREILLCLEELRELKVMHMDLGVRNMIFTQNSMFYIIDWEFGRIEQWKEEDLLYKDEILPDNLKNLGLMGTPENGHFDDAYAALRMMKDLCPSFKKDYYEDWLAFNRMIGEYHYEFKRSPGYI